MAKRIPVSFKEKKAEEMELYEYANRKMCPSAYIKELIKKDKEKQHVPSDSGGILDF